MSRIRPELRLYSASADARAAEPDDLRAFRAAVARRAHTTRDGSEWVYFDSGPHGQPPLVLLHGTSGTAAALFRQVTALSAHGVRAISVRIAAPLPARARDQRPPFRSNTAVDGRMRSGRPHLTDFWTIFGSARCGARWRGLRAAYRLTAALAGPPRRLCVRGLPCPSVCLALPLACALAGAVQQLRGHGGICQERALRQRVRAPQGVQ